MNRKIGATDDSADLEQENIELLDELRKHKEELIALRRKYSELEDSYRSKSDQCFELEKELESIHFVAKNDEKKFEIAIIEKSNEILLLQKEIELFKENGHIHSKNTPGDINSSNNLDLSIIPITDIVHVTDQSSTSDENQPEEVDSRIIFLENELLERHERLEKAEHDAREFSCEVEQLKAKMILMEQLLDTTRATRDALLTKASLKVSRSQLPKKKNTNQISADGEEDYLDVEDEIVILDGYAVMSCFRELEGITDGLREQASDALLRSNTPLMPSDNTGHNPGKSRSFVSLHEELLDSSRAHHRVLISSSRSQSGAAQLKRTSAVSTPPNNNNNGEKLIDDDGLDQNNSGDDNSSLSSSSSYSSSSSDADENPGQQLLRRMRKSVQLGATSSSANSPLQRSKSLSARRNPLVPVLLINEINNNQNLNPPSPPFHLARIQHLEKLCQSHENQIAQLKLEISNRIPTAVQIRSDNVAKKLNYNHSFNSCSSSPDESFLIENTAMKISTIARRLEFASAAVTEATSKLALFVDGLSTPKNIPPSPDQQVTCQNSPTQQTDDSPELHAKLDFLLEQVRSLQSASANNLLPLPSPEPTNLQKNALPSQQTSTYRVAAESFLSEARDEGTTDSNPLDTSRSGRKSLKMLSSLVKEQLEEKRRIKKLRSENNLQPFIVVQDNLSAEGDKDNGIHSAAFSDDKHSNNISVANDLIGGFFGGIFSTTKFPLKSTTSGAHAPKNDINNNSNTAANALAAFGFGGVHVSSSSTSTPSLLVEQNTQHLQ